MPCLPKKYKKHPNWGGKNRTENSGPTMQPQTGHCVVSALNKAKSFRSTLQN